ncbi:MAG: methyl-accepting chemotaxis protein [Verrucomicrobiota bacterium]
MKLNKKLLLSVGLTIAVTFLIGKSISVFTIQSHISSLAADSDPDTHLTELQSISSLVLWVASLEALATVVLSLATLLYFSRQIISRSLTSGLSEALGLAGSIGKTSRSMMCVSEVHATASTEQAASLVESCSSIEMMNESSKENLKRSKEAANFAADALKATQQGGVRMERMSEAMTDIREATQGIAQIIKTIEEIAFQTNILALNAAVEAARAGEAGSGFAVVADEVRNLAQKSSAAADSSSKLIERNNAKTEHGERITAEVAESLAEITGLVQKLDEFISSISHSSSEQSEGISQIREGMLILQQTTQQSSTDSEEAAQNANRLKYDSEQMTSILLDLLDIIDAAQQRDGEEKEIEAPEKKPSQDSSFPAADRSGSFENLDTALESVGTDSKDDSVVLWS